MAGRGGHHGGAWKVAYADFITTMMALFLVLWLTAQDAKIKEAIERSFRNPFSSLTKESVGLLPNPEATALERSRGSFDSPTAVQLEVLRRVTDDLSKLLQNDAEEQPTVRIEHTPDGLRVNVFDRPNRPIFEPESISFTPFGAWVFSTMAWVVARYPTFVVELEGHTPVGVPLQKPEYSAWELSADRANAARRKLVERGVGGNQIFKVVGYGESQTLLLDNPEDASNNRVTVLLRIGERTRNDNRSGSVTSSDTTPATPHPGSAQTASPTAPTTHPAGNHATPAHE